MAEKSLRELDLASLASGRTFFPSPQNWEDEIIYFLLADRFSNNTEDQYRGNDGAIVTGGATPPFAAADNGNAVTTGSDAARWREAGTRFVGGTLAGIESKLGYLQRLGVTVVWISPILKQVAADESYHGYGIQDFLDVDPRFGTRDDLRRLVDTAHSMNIRVILDVILNHTGDVFRYSIGDPYWNGQTFQVRGFRDAGGNPSLPFGPIDLTAHPGAYPDGAVWPAEFQDPASFTRAGRIRNFDYFPEYADGDFYSLKDLRHGERRYEDGVEKIDKYAVSPALRHLSAVYKFWIAFADLDGFRLDTVKHMDAGATRYFASTIHEFAQALGKENFYIIGEITGGRKFAVDLMETTGLNAALGISDERMKMIGLVKGEMNPVEYFDVFRNSLQVGKDSHAWFRNKVVTSLDDHDHVDQGDRKQRFAAGGSGGLTLAVMGLNACTLGIPCVYYGSEQLFDGEGSGGGGDRYIREAMFGGEFGAFRSRGRHFFLEDGFVFQELRKIHRLRRSLLPLRRGRQYLREISGNGIDFGIPKRIGSDLMRSIVAWSRIFNEVEVLCALNTDPFSPGSAFVTIEDALHEAGDVLTCLYSTASAEIGRTITVEAKNGKAVALSVPASGFVIYG